MPGPPTASQWIDRLGMTRHPEGGYFVETYRSSLQIDPARGHGARSASTAIYFLLERGDYSAMHRIASDEGWHLYAGGPLLVHVIDRDGELRTIQLGLNLDGGEAPQAHVSGGCWFGSEVADCSQAGYALVGCTVAPGFEFADFELAERERLIEQFPQHRALITRLTRT